MRSVRIEIISSTSREGELSFRAATDGRASTFYRELNASGFIAGERCVIVSEEDYDAHFPGAARGQV